MDFAVGAGEFFPQLFGETRRWLECEYNELRVLNSELPDRDTMVCSEIDINLPAHDR